MAQNRPRRGEMAVGRAPLPAIEHQGIGVPGNQLQNPPAADGVPYPASFAHNAPNFIANIGQYTRKFLKHHQCDACSTILRRMDNAKPRLHNQLVRYQHPVGPEYAALCNLALSKFCLDPDAEEVMREKCKFCHLSRNEYAQCREIDKLTNYCLKKTGYQVPEDRISKFLDCLPSMAVWFPEMLSGHEIAMMPPALPPSGPSQSSFEPPQTAWYQTPSSIPQYPQNLPDYSSNFGLHQSQYQQHPYMPTGYEALEASTHATNVTTQMEQLEFEAGEASSRIRNLEADNMQLEQDAREASSRITSLEADKARMEGDARETRSRITSLEADQLQLETDNREARSRITSLEADKARMEGDARETRSRITSLEADKLQLETDNREARSQITSLEADKVRLEQDARDARFQITSLLAEKQQMETNLAEATDAETAFLEASRLEAVRLEADRIEAARLEADRVEAARLEMIQLEAALLADEEAEKEALEKIRRSSLPAPAATPRQRGNNGHSFLLTWAVRSLALLGVFGILGAILLVPQHLSASHSPVQPYHSQTNVQTVEDNTCIWNRSYVYDHNSATGLESGCSIEAIISRAVNDDHATPVAEAADACPGALPQPSNFIFKTMSLGFDKPYKVVGWAVVGGLAWSAWTHFA